MPGLYHCCGEWGERGGEVRGREGEGAGCRIAEAQGVGWGAKEERVQVGRAELFGVGETPGGAEAIAGGHTVEASTST